MVISPLGSYSPSLNNLAVVFLGLMSSKSLKQGVQHRWVMGVFSMILLGFCYK